MDIILIRHGEKQKIQHYNPELRRNDPPLTNRGIKQAQITGNFLNSYKIDKIYSSDVLRTLQTSTHISPELSLTFTPQAKLREIYFGDLETEGWVNFQTLAPEIYKIYRNRNRDFNYPNGESGQDAFHRVHPFIKQIIQENRKKVVIVAHGGIIRVLICGLLNIPFGHRFNMGNPIFNCSLSTLHYSATSGNFQLHDFNSIGHLPVELHTG